MKDLFRDLQRLTALSPNGEELAKSLVLSAWKKAVGEALQGRTRAVDLIGTRLIVAVADDTWKRHLEGVADQMIFKVNSVMRSASVTFIDFEVRPDLFTDPVERPSEDSSWREEVDEELIRSAKEIGDEEMRQDFVKMAAKLSARRKRMDSSG